MSKISLEYNGNLRCNLTHNASKTEIITDAPTDNNGKGESFSPTDLVASALAACMVTVIGIQNEQKNIGITKMRSTIEKVMSSSPRRISEIKIRLEIQSNEELTSRQKINVTQVAEGCPVALSLDKGLKQSIQINFTH